MNIQTRLHRQVIAYLYFGLFSVFLIGFSGFQIYKSHQATLDDSKATIDSYISISETGIRATIGSIDVLLKQILHQSNNDSSKFKKISNSDLLVKREFLKPLLAIDFRTFDANGNLISSSEGAAPFNIADREFFIKHREQKNEELIVSTPMRGRSKAGNWIFTISRRVLSNSGKFLGIASATLEARLFDSFKNQIKLGSNTLFAVTTGSPPHFAYRSPDKGDFTGKPFTYHQALEPVVSGKEIKGVFETVSVNDKIRRLVGISHLKNSNMMIVIGRDYDEVMQAWWRQSLLFLAFTFLAILIAFILTWKHLKQSQAIRDHQLKLIGSSKLASLGEMSAGIAHEINNPLAIIDGISQQLYSLAGNPEKLTQKIDTIRKSVERISRIIKGLEKFSRSSERRSLGNHSLSKIAAEVLTLTDAKANRNNTSVKIVKDCGALIYCDDVEIEQVLINLISNSIDAVKDRRDNKWVKIDITENENAIVLRVTDSGTGIPEDLKYRIFEPFFTTKPVGKGTGLGLSIIKGILDEHSATIAVTSDSPNTCFEIRFPKKTI